MDNIYGKNIGREEKWVNVSKRCDVEEDCVSADDLEGPLVAVGRFRCLRWDVTAISITPSPLTCIHPLKHPHNKFIGRDKEIT